MREQERRRLDAAGRERMRSPGRPPAARRGERQRFWAAIARGLPSEDAAVVAGVSPAVGARWFRQAGGMPPITQSALSGRYLSLAEREEIAILRARGCGVREIARRAGRPASTISRELRRNAATRGECLEYRATTAQWHAGRRARRPKAAKLAVNGPLRRYVEERLAGAVRRPDDGACVDGPDVRWIGRRHGRRKDRRWATAWSPEQIANRVRADFPDDDSMRISHEAIYQALYVQGRGALRRELTACLRSGRALRVPRARSRRGKSFVGDEVLISERPAEAADRAVPGHWEGDLILGLGSSAIGTLVERSTRFTLLLHLPPMHGDSSTRVKNGPALAGHGAEAVRNAIPTRSRLFPSSSAVRSPGIRDPRWPSTRNCGSTPACRCTSVTRTARGSAARTRTRTVSCASTSRKEQTSQDTASTPSPLSRPHLTADPARHSAGKRRPRRSTNTYDRVNRTSLRRPVESGLRAAIGVRDQPFARSTQT